MRTAILGAVAAVGVTAGTASAHPPGYGYGYGGYAPVVVRPAPVVVAPAPVVVAPTSGFSIGFGVGGFSGVYSSGGFYRPAYGYGGYPAWGYGGYRPYYGGYGYGHHHHHHGW